MRYFIYGLFFLSIVCLSNAFSLSSNYKLLVFQHLCKWECRILLVINLYNVVLKETKSERVRGNATEKKTHTLTEWYISAKEKKKEKNEQRTNHPFVVHQWCTNQKINRRYNFHCIWIIEVNGFLKNVKMILTAQVPPYCRQWSGKTKP